MPKGPIETREGSVVRGALDSSNGRGDPVEVAEILEPQSGFQIHDGLVFLQHERRVETLELGGRPKERPVTKRVVRRAQRALNGQG